MCVCVVSLAVDRMLLELSTGCLTKKLPKQHTTHTHHHITTTTTTPPLLPAQALPSPPVSHQLAAAP